MNGGVGALAVSGASPKLLSSLILRDSFPWFQIAEEFWSQLQANLLHSISSRALKLQADEPGLPGSTRT